MREHLTEAATELIRDCGKPIRTFSGASIRGHAVWMATYHGGTAACKSFTGGTYGKLLEAFANLWGSSLEHPYPDTDRVRTNAEELHLNGCKVLTAIKVLEGCGYFVAVRFPEEVSNWRARQIVTAIGPDLIQKAEEAYNTNSKLK